MNVIPGCYCALLGLPCECRRGPGRPAFRPCGTLAAYRRHLRRGEPVDRACLEACRRAQQDRAAAGYVRPSRRAAAA